MHRATVTVDGKPVPDLTIAFYRKMNRDDGARGEHVGNARTEQDGVAAVGSNYDPESNRDSFRRTVEVEAEYKSGRGYCLTRSQAPFTFKEQGAGSGVP
jgi:hypothetical protein